MVGTAGPIWQIRKVGLGLREGQQRAGSPSKKVEESHGNHRQQSSKASSFYYPMASFLAPLPPVLTPISPFLQKTPPSIPLGQVLRGTVSHPRHRGPCS